jgi:leucyl/phenylalanyl-tRNA--protein transferase
MMARLRTGNFGSLFSEGIEPEPASPPATRRQRRRAALRETPWMRTQRLMRVAARLARPWRPADLAATFARLARAQLFGSANLPDPRDALACADGLAGLAIDLAPAAMIEAYGKGLAPCASLGPIAWHSRANRSVASPADIARDDRLAVDDPAPDWTVSFDRDIDLVLARSGRPCNPCAIIPARLLDAFADLFDAGFAHCFAVRDGRGQTIGGGFGVAVGGVFMIEGAFEIVPGAARFGLAQLSRRLDAWKYAQVECAPGAAWLDCGLFRPMPRDDYLSLLRRHMGEEKIGRWRDGLADGAPAEAERPRLAA